MSFINIFMNNNFFGTNFISKTGPVEVKLSEVKIVVLYFAASNNHYI